MFQFQKIWGPVVTVVGAVLLILQLSLAFMGNRTLVTGLLILISLIAMAAGLWNYAFATSVIKGFPRYRYQYGLKILWFLVLVLIFVSSAYVLTLLGIVPDCCGLVATGTSVSPTTSVVLPPQGWVMVMQDQFVDDQYKWTIERSEHEIANTQDEKYLFVVLDAPMDNVYPWVKPDIRPQSDLFYGIDVKVISAAPATSCGLAFHIIGLGAKQYGYYRFEIRNTHEYRIRRIDDTNYNNSTDLVPWTKDPVIKPEQTNRLVAIVQKKHFNFYINGKLVADTLEDPSYTLGFIGVVIRTDKKGQSGTCEFDNAEVWKPQS
jgi:hypothetical protein